ncbi:hypothetical protein MKW94_030545 [Papaver nudicaule]|uniref:Uncharacterized protein n=1 Tax=Papaver nudicaule TaxID=74823 RepID=A0AA42AXS7_PAPNU|nr:hypothetical protein [Papaver nudicaule]
MERDEWPRPEWHAPWWNYKVIRSNLGRVTSIAFDPGNSWFCTGAADRTVKIWDVGTGRLKHKLTGGHTGQVRGLAVSKRHPYMYSAGDDKQVNWCFLFSSSSDCRHFVYSVCRVWDTRTDKQIHALSAHDDTVSSLLARSTHPQIITGSHDTTIKFWDLRKERWITGLLHNKKSIRALAINPTGPPAFVSAGEDDNIKKFILPTGPPAADDNIKKFILPRRYFPHFSHNMLSQQNEFVNLKP